MIHNGCFRRNVMAALSVAISDDVSIAVSDDVRVADFLRDDRWRRQWFGVDSDIRGMPAFKPI